jgi:hypothetical protein
MRISTNDKLIARQTKIARYATFGGLALLLGSLVLSFNGAYIGPAYAALLAGFALAYFGSMLAHKWIREPRGDHALGKALKGFDNKHHLYNYLLPANHVLLGPAGLMIFRIKPHDGNVTYSKGKWQRPWQWTRLFGGMGQEPLGDPIRELSLDLLKMKQLISSKIENVANVPIEGYVVFTDPRVRLSLDDSSISVVRAEELKDTVRKNKRGIVLAPQLQDDLERILDETANAKAA